MALLNIPGNLLIIIAAVFTALFISYSSIPAIIRIAEMKNLLDEPDEKRKLHKTIIPTLGGVAIFASFLISYSVWGNAVEVYSYPAFVGGVLTLFLIGIKDDILMLSPAKKLMAQVFASFVVVIGGNLGITNLDGVFGIHAIPGFIGILLAAFVMIATINAYNLVDGIDGLAGGIGIICTTVFGVWFWGAGFTSLAILSFVLAGSLAGFLIYNFSPARIFMGDTGSMVVGFILGYLALNFIQLNQPSSSALWKMSGAPAFAFAVLIIPAFDSVRVFIIRLINKQSPFVPDNNHIHHRLLQMGFKHSGSAVMLYLANITIVLVAVGMKDYNPNLMIVTAVCLASMIMPTIRVLSKGLGSFYPRGLSGKTQRYQP